MIVLKFQKEIKGDSTASGYQDHIILESVEFGAARSIIIPTGKTARESGHPSFSEISCAKKFDIASTELFMQSVSGSSLGEATITYLQTDTEGNPEPFLIITLKDPIVTSYQNSSYGDRPEERFRMNFTKIQLAYTQYSGEVAKKASPKGWDLLESKAA
ncbi:type VI secretion system tube protein Hcp [Planctomycetaceae bacterium SH139]